MEPGCGADPAPVSQSLPRNCEQLIRKLRWIVFGRRGETPGSGGLHAAARRKGQRVCRPVQHRLADGYRLGLGSAAGPVIGLMREDFRRPGEGWSAGDRQPSYEFATPEQSGALKRISRC